MKFSVRRPDGKVIPFAFVETFAAYVAGWSDVDFVKVWPLPFCCLIQARKAPF